MEETKKVFSQKAISIATYIGGPVAAGYLLQKNYQTFNEPEKGKKAFFIGAVSTIFIFVGIFLLPEQIVDMIPNVLIPAIYTGIVYWIVEKEQGGLLTAHKETEGKFHSGWKAAGIGGIFMMILIVFIVGFAFIAGDFSKPDFDPKTYDNGIVNFLENEEKSMAVFDVVETADSQYLVLEFKKNIVLWKENKDIIKELNLIENLPDELLKQNIMLLKYSELRIQHCEIMLKALIEDTDKYIPEIQKIGLKIDTLLQELEKLNS